MLITAFSAIVWYSNANFFRYGNTYTLALVDFSAVSRSTRMHMEYRTLSRTRRSPTLILGASTDIS